MKGNPSFTPQKHQNFSEIVIIKYYIEKINIFKNNKYVYEYISRFYKEKLFIAIYVLFYDSKKKYILGI